MSSPTLAITLLVLGISSSSHGFLFSKKVCYDRIGCFSTDAPFTNTKKTPDTPEHINVQFLLYTRQNPTSAHHLVSHDAGSVRSSHFNSHWNTKFIIHGYQDSGTTSWIKHMTSEILKHEDANVVAVDWSRGAAKINYLQAAANTRVVGALIAELIHTIHQSQGASYSSFHVIGHSLGSHIAGYAGEKVHGLGRITGLDPAGPSFENYGAEVRLDPTDANFVDAIHSDSDSLLQLGFGLEKAVGDADFYPNGGRKQPGCNNELGKHLFSVITGGIVGFTDSVACSHMRVLDFFTESINSHCAFTAQPCNSRSDFEAGRCTSCSHGCSKMGYHATPGHGTYYLTTNSHHPFCLH